MRSPAASVTECRVSAPALAPVWRVPVVMAVDRARRRRDQEQPRGGNRKPGPGRRGAESPAGTLWSRSHVTCRSLTVRRAEQSQDHNRTAFLTTPYTPFIMGTYEMSRRSEER